MLADTDRELLTAYVDGELSARQTRQAHKLLRRSNEARRLLRQLQGDSRELRALPTPPLGFDLSETVVQAIAKGRLQPRRQPAPEPAAPLYAAWASYAAAAAVLLFAGVASYLAFSSAVERERNGTVASQKRNGSDGAPEKNNSPSPSHRNEDPQHDPPNKNGNESPIAPSPIEVVKAPSQAKPKVGPDYDPNREEPDAVLTDRVWDMIKFDKVPDGPPALIRLHDLDQDAVRQKLLTELSKAGGFRMDLPSSNAAKGLERLRSALKAEQITMTLDAAGAAKQKAPNYALLLEDLTPEEFARVFQHLGGEDKKAVARRDDHFKALFVYRMGEKDHKELSNLLGVDPTSAPPKPSTPMVDVRKPLSEGTADQLKPRSDKGTRLALVLPYHPGKSRPAAAEVKRYLASRRPARPGTLQVLLVLRDI